MRNLTLERLAGLVRTKSVHRVFITPYPAIDGGGWLLDIDHNDHGLTRQMYTQRGWLRVFKSADAAINALRTCGYSGQVVVVVKPEGD
jgi:hypothetical protein